MKFNVPRLQIALERLNTAASGSPAQPVDDRDDKHVNSEGMLTYSALT